MNPIQEFQKRAAAAGLTPEQVAAYIEANGLEAKLASPTPADFFAAVIAEANVEKTAESLAYTEGFLRQAADRGVPVEAAVQVTKNALAATFPAVKVEKQAAASEVDQEKAAYFAGMFEKGAAFGLDQQQTAQLIQKFAEGGVPGLLQRAGTAVGRLASGAKDVVREHPNITGGLGGAFVAGGLTGTGAKLHQMSQTTMDRLQQLIAEHPEIAGAVGGAGVGGLAGGLSGLPGEADPNDPSASEGHVGRNALLGALAGGGAGAGAGHFAPDMFKRLA